MVYLCSTWNTASKQQFHDPCSFMVLGNRQSFSKAAGWKSTHHRPANYCSTIQPPSHFIKGEIHQNLWLQRYKWLLLSVWGAVHEEACVSCQKHLGNWNSGQFWVQSNTRVLVASIHAGSTLELRTMLREELLIFISLSSWSQIWSTQVNCSHHILLIEDF